MKLNPDCIRDLLLCLEEFPGYGRTFVYESMDAFKDKCGARLEGYSTDEIGYHFNQCNLSGFLYHSDLIPGGLKFVDLTPKAHEFLANIRKDTTWNEVKTVASKVGSTSLNALVQISSNVITELIKAQFNLA